MPLHRAIFLIYQQQVVAKELLNRREGVVYKVPLGVGKLKCPFPCTRGSWQMGMRCGGTFRICTRWTTSWLGRRGITGGVHAAGCR